MMRLRILCATIAALAVTASAEVYLVTPDGSGDFPTLQAAIAAVSDGDTIGLEDGVFVGSGNRGIDFTG